MTARDPFHGPAGTWLAHLASLAAKKGVAVAVRYARTGSRKVSINGGRWQDVAPATRALERLTYGVENP